LGISVTTSSPKGLPFTYRLTNAPIHGKLSGSIPSLTYPPDTGYVGTDKFTFPANDGNSDTNISSIGISVEKKPLIQGLDGTATRIGAFSILSAAIFGMKQLLCTQRNFVRC
jgi:hypothetical protein